MSLTFRLANESDEDILISQFDHYNNKLLQKKRAECYIHHNSTFFMILDNEIIGRIQWYIKEDPRLGVVELEEIFICERYRHRGYGYKFLKAAISIIKKNTIPLHSIFLFVGKENHAMVNIMKKMDFKQVAIISNLFKKDEIVYFFVKSFH